VSATLEQEMAALVESREYVVRMLDSGYLHVHVIYVPSLRMHESGKFVAANGEIAHQLFSRPFKFKRAGRWVRKTIRQHQTMLKEMGPVTLA